MRLVWLTVNSSYSHSSLALPLIHAACKDVPGIEWSHVVCTKNDDMALVASQIVAGSPHLLCVPLYIFSCTQAIDIILRVKTLLPKVVVIAGGPECHGGGVFRILGKYPQVDFCIRGEGETPFRELLQQLTAGAANYADICGLAYKDENGEIRANGGEAVYAEWADAPMPCLDEFFDSSKPFIQLESSRGCPHSCLFCTSANTSLRYRSVERMEAELTELARRGVREIRMLDRTFNQPQRRAEALLRLFRTRFPEIRFHLEIHPAYIDDGLAAELEKANPGQLHLEVGVQSLAQEALAGASRDGTAQKVRLGLEKLASDKALTVHLDLLAGLPGQKLDDIYCDLKALDGIAVEEIQLETVKILAGTRLERQAAELGIVYSPLPPYDVMRTPDMSSQDILQARLLSHILDAYHNVPSLADFFRAVNSAGILRIFVEFMSENGFGLGTMPHLKKRFELATQFVATQPDLAMRGKLLGLLACGWLKEAFPLGLGPAANARLIRELPEDIRLIEGLLPEGENKFVQCENLIFVYNRGVAPNKAVAVFTLE